jgi:hypothetical protein
MVPYYTPFAAHSQIILRVLILYTPHFLFYKTVNEERLLLAVFPSWGHYMLYNILVFRCRSHHSCFCSLLAAISFLVLFSFVGANELDWRIGDTLFL